MVFLALFGLLFLVTRDLLFLLLVFLISLLMVNDACTSLLVGLLGGATLSLPTLIVCLVI